ncbi:anion transporter [Thermosinus carboxydivorans Nor1]|uniref:Sodium-dependent dicarboxylate transporter SdcS n=1 Tax=Thermosinus carboxydivorans Nor1 TaxID=401526 RepID=A1HMM6_9FIRM|nr:DASS family sodium-coupled anion symporter [Thermosinus carboxydivorans]EAX48516.1 anion transporter [Thermosinus carboxydivorans Nor1]
MSRQKWLALAIAFAALAAIVWFTPAVAGLKASGKAALGVAVFAIVIWATQAVDDALSGLMIVFLLASLNATSLGGAFSGYANTALWLIVIGFIMAACMEKSGLSKRIALILVNAAGGSAGKVYWAVAAVMAVMSFLVPSITARTLLMLPIILGIGQAFDAKQGQSNIVKALLFIVAMSGTMMSIGILTAHVGNPITAGLIESATKKAISWSEWFRVGGPPAFTLAFISVYVLRLMWKPEIESLGQGQDYVRRELAALGPLSKQELYTLVVFLVTLVLWATDSLHKVNVVIVGLLAVLLLLWPGRGVMNWKEAQQKVPWNVFIVYGAGLSMGTALVSSGAAKWLAGTMLSPIANMPHAMQIIVLIWIVTALQVFFTGGGPKTTALTPVVIAHAVAIGADPLVFALILGMNMQHQYLLPVSNMPNAVAMGTGHITAGELFRTGLVMSILGAAFMSAMVVTYWKWIGIVQ